MGFVLHRELRPRFFADTPPAVAIELIDEATPSVPVQWTITRGDKQIGSLNTRMVHQPDTDTFRFIHRYTNVKIEFQAGIAFAIPTAETTVVVTREGEFRGQSMKGKGEIELAGLSLLSGSITIESRVENGQLRGECQAKTSLGNIERNLEPVTIQEGQILNPLMPVNRLRDVSPGRRWTIRLNDPLMDSLKIMIEGAVKSQKFLTLPKNLGSSDNELIAEVKQQQDILTRPGSEPVACWVIEYRREQPIARTWVAVADGKVVRQEAQVGDDLLRFDRRD
jgi:hypothetical protein